MSNHHPQMPQGYNAIRLCEWCGGPLTDNQIVACCSSHRLKRWRWLNGISVSPYAGVGRPPEGSPLLTGSVASGGVQTADQGSRVSNGGLQVSAMRMFRELQRDPPYLTERCAREVVARCLSERQRGRFLRRVGAAPGVLSGQLDLEGREAA